jgi:hypothetical protein
MCFKKPKTPKVYADPALKQQQLDERAAAAAIRAEDKERRTQDRVAALSGRLGRNGLLGAPGAAGFAAPAARSLFVTVGG